jgi:hypothetical protein
MDLNYSEHELWTMIEALASGRGNLQERAVLTNKYLVPLKLGHVPEALRGELQTLKTSGASAQRMSEDEAYYFVMQLLSFYGKFRSSST